MATFAYEARDAEGLVDAGVLTAPSLDDAARSLRREGKTIISVREEGGNAAAGRRRRGRRRIGLRDVILMTNQLGVMVDTGVTLSEALDAIAMQARNPAMEGLVDAISTQVKGGVEFSTALEQHPKVFGRLYVAMMKASEASGTMATMLQRLAEYLEQEQDLRRKIRGAMLYPVGMLVFSLLVVAAMIVFVLPRFQRIYEGRHAVLPLPTRALLGISSAVVDNWAYLLPAAVLAGVGLYLYLRSDSGRRLVDRARIRLPILGSMYRKAYMARSLRTMATMVGTGVSMLEGLEITARVAGNCDYRDVWLNVLGGVTEGGHLADELRGSDLIPPGVTQMIAAGERSGRLADVMNRVAKFCEDDLSAAIKVVTGVIEPLMIVFVGALVGSIALAMLLPIFTMSKVVAH